ncbi:CBS domain-containing protein [Nocardioides ungokensis]|uniref:CBS domain-containing protein n=1 Tax=Nocardioides ungokensis TaxID=1643322 RepID=UPI001FE58448|nr:CBS domain-containing protein [Nocardioides ungokensis]
MSLEVNDRASDVIELARQTGHSRFPVLDTEESVVGTVHVKHVVALPVHERATTKVKHLMAKPIVVPDSLRLDPLLALLRKDGFQMAVVLDDVRRPRRDRDPRGRGRGDRGRHRRRA